MERALRFFGRGGAWARARLRGATGEEILEAMEERGWIVWEGGGGDTASPPISSGVGRGVWSERRSGPGGVWGEVPMNAPRGSLRGAPPGRVGSQLHAVDRDAVDR